MKTLWVADLLQCTLAQRSGGGWPAVPSWCTGVLHTQIHKCVGTFMPYCQPRFPIFNPFIGRHYTLHSLHRFVTVLGSNVQIFLSGSTAHAHRYSFGLWRDARSGWEAIATNEIARTRAQIMTFVVRAQHPITLAGRNKEQDSILFPQTNKMSSRQGYRKHFGY